MHNEEDAQTSIRRDSGKRKRIESEDHTLDNGDEDFDDHTGMAIRRSSPALVGRGTSSHQSNERMHRTSGKEMCNCC